MANIKKLDVLNSEGPVILATREVGSDTIQFKFDRGGAIKISKTDFTAFIYEGKEIDNPFNERERYVFMSFSSDMRASDVKIQEFLQD